jgi:hypothetical protein
MGNGVPELRASPRGAPIGMRALTHPAALLAVSLLLLNDHLLKRVVPSVLTGKLSDLAGLVFFPMLATMLVAGLLRLRSRHSAWAAGIVFALTGALFAVLKAVAPVNAVALALADRWLGIRLQLALDPSDLWALAVLPPAFVLWRRAESGPRPVSLRAGVLSASVAALAALATSPCPPEQPISRLLLGSDGVYAVAHAWDPFSSVYRSRDRGQTWEALQEADVPADIAGEALEPAVLPVQACLLAQPQWCYRIDGVQPQVEQSRDGGATWEAAWSPPASRLSYMRRVASGAGELLACGKEIDFTPHDLILLEEGGEAMVLVALGNEGVLRGPARGEAWERLGVGWAEATPERASSLGDLWPPSTILNETLALFAAAAIAFLVFSSRSWALSPRRPDASGNSHRGFWWAAGILFALVVVGAILLGVEELLLPVGIPMALGLAYLAFLGQRWSIAIEDSLEAGAVQRCLWISLAATFGCAGLAWLFFALWIFGIVPIYSLALVLAAGVLMAGWLWGWRQIGRTIHSAAPASRGPAGGSSLPAK